MTRSPSASDWESRELKGEAASGAPAWLLGKIGDRAESIADETRPEMDPEVEQGLRALGYIE